MNSFFSGCIFWLSEGDGKKSFTISKAVWSPIFFKVEPQITGITEQSSTPCLSPRWISAVVNSIPLKYLSISSSSVSATASNSISWIGLIWLSISAGISTVLHSFFPLSNSLANISTTLIWPLNPSPFPQATWNGAIRFPYFSLNCERIFS